MSQNVPTEGFQAPGGAPIIGGQPNLPPSNPQPGFVVPPAGAPVVPPAQEPQQPKEPAATPDLTAALAALTAALGTPKPAEPVPAPVQNPLGDLNEYDIGSIDDPILKSMATVMKTVGQGIDMDRALGKAIDNGRIDLIDVAYLREKGGANSEQLITIAQGLVQAIEAKSVQVTQSIHNLAGGEVNWNASVAAFNAGAPAELRTVIAQMLDSGKDNLREAGAKLIVEYGKNSGKIPNVNPLVQAGAAGMPQAQALSKEGFQSELRKLNPQARDFQTQRGELFARRQLGRNIGL